VTGSNTGMGKELAQMLYTKHAKVYLATRTREKALEAIQEVRKTAPSSVGDLVFLLLDLAGPTTIKAWGTQELQEAVVSAILNSLGCRMKSLSRLVDISVH
jgi:retinol dehydrogenase-12